PVRWSGSRECARRGPLSSRVRSVSSSVAHSPPRRNENRRKTVRRGPAPDPSGFHPEPRQGAALDPPGPCPGPRPLFIKSGAKTFAREAYASRGSMSEKPRRVPLAETASAFFHNYRRPGVLVTPGLLCALGIAGLVVVHAPDD